MKKGNLYYGPTGVGKTHILEQEYNNLPVLEDTHKQRYNKHWMDTSDLCILAAKEGLVGVRNLAQTFTNFYLDEVGHESLTVSHFGTVFCPVAEFIKARYLTCKKSKLEMTTHITTNLGPEELASTYGAFIQDRLVEMCSWTKIEGESRRK